jgi:hypothetical protein
MVPLELFEEMLELDSIGVSKMLSYLYPWVEADNAAHSRVNLASLIDSMKSKEFAKACDMVGGIVKVRKLLAKALYDGLGYWSNTMASSIFIGIMSSKQAVDLFTYFIEKCGGLRLTRRGWVKSFKAMNDLLKKQRVSPHNKEHLLDARDMAKLGYVVSLASKGFFGIDMGGEYEKRAKPRAQQVSYDPGRDAFTSVQYLKDSQEAWYFTYSLMESISAENIEGAYAYWLRRQNWAASGSAAGFSSSVPSGTERASNHDVEDMARRVAQAWISKAKERSGQSDDLRAMTRSDMRS